MPTKTTTATDLDNRIADKLDQITKRLLNDQPVGVLQNAAVANALVAIAQARAVGTIPKATNTTS